MKELEEALKYFDLKENFTEEELNKAYKEKQNIIYVDFKEKKRNKEIALNLLAYNTPIDVIAKSTGLSIEEIKKLEQ